MKSKIIKSALFSFGLTLLIMGIILYLIKMVPFGNGTFASMDANIQYLDFFGYLKNIICGQDSIVYTYNSTLGNTGIGVFSYYLTSPFNIMIAFFEKADFVLFFNMVVVLKIALASSTFAIFLEKRFNGKIRSSFVVILSLCFALMQYNIAQNSNIMWLDGVYMLPLIALGIRKLVAKKKSIFLSICVGLTIIFNWYSGGIDCVFSFFYFVVEEIIYIIEENKKFKDAIKNIVIDGIHFGIAMVIGVMISAFIFLPSVYALRNGVGSTFDWRTIENDFLGNVMSVIPSYSIGAVSTPTSVSIYCGSIPLIAAILYFLDKRENKKIRIVLGIALFISIMFCYWQPFFIAFSLLKTAYSYLFRYSYVIIFMLIFVAAHYFRDMEHKETSQKIIIPSVIFSVVMMIMNYVKPFNEEKYVFYTCAFLVIASVLLYSVVYYKNKRKVFTVLLLGITCFELLTNGKLLQKKYISNDGEIYKNYVIEQEKQIKELKEFDDGLYRIGQTETRNFDRNTFHTANYNESLAHSYMTNTGYTSCPDNDTIVFLDRVGYRCLDGRITVTNTSILGVDSLLGVKYVLSPYSINGLEQITNICDANEKQVYVNKYALPVAFKYTANEEKTREDSNYFEYQNEIFSKLAGKDVELYKKATFEKISDGNNVTYKINVPNDNPLYCNIPGNMMNIWVDVNDVYSISYAAWLSPTVFYVPTNKKISDIATVEVINESSIPISEDQIYYVDLGVLEELSSKIKSKGAENIKFNKKGNIECSINGNEGEYLLITVPYSNGFKIYRNGELIEGSKFENCLMQIPLVDGENKINIKYELPGLKLGIVTTVLGIISLIGVYIISKKINNNKNN